MYLSGYLLALLPGDLVALLPGHGAALLPLHGPAVLPGHLLAPLLRRRTWLALLSGHLGQSRMIRGTVIVIEESSYLGINYILLVQINF